MKIKNYQSGLRLVVNTKKDIDIVCFKLFINVGSTSESKDEFGLAHFIEHMFFKSTPNYSNQEISSIYDELGTRINAYTSTHDTCFYFKSLKKVLEPSLKMFSEQFFNNSYKIEEISNEKKVVIEEYKMGNDDFNRACLINANKSMFFKTDIEHDIIGTIKHINSFKEEDIRRFKARHYLPQNIVISVSGNVTLKEVEKLIKKYFSGLLNGEYNKEHKLPLYIKPTPKSNFVVQNKENEQSVVCILTDLGEKTEKQMYAFDVFAAILGYGMSSKLFNIVRTEKGLVYDINASTEQIGNNNLLEVNFSTSNNSVCKALGLVLSIIKNCSNGDITQEELEKSKNKYLAGLVYSKETNSGISSMNGISLIYRNKIFSPEQIKNEINNVSLEQVITCAKEVYTQQNYVVSCVGKCQRSQIVNCYKH